MPAYGYTVAEAPAASNSAWRMGAIVCAACATTVAVLTAVAPAAPVQHFAPAAAATSTVAPAVAGLAASARTATTMQAASAPEALSAATELPMFFEQPESHSGKAAAFFGAGALLIGAAVAAARQLMAPAKPEAIAMLASSSAKEDKERMRQMVESLDMADMRLLSRGGSMEDVARSKGIEDVAKAIRADQASRKDLTPKDVILEMQRGNGRFWMGLSERPDMNAMQRRALIMAQAPKICLLSCSDSRVPVEIIFDQGLGDIFVVRMAGNILDANAHGSIEYAVKYLGVKVIMVIGHEGCGAVKGAMTMSADDIAKEPKDLQVVLKNIKNNLDVEELKLISDTRSREREAIVINTSHQVKELQQNKLIAEQVANGSLMVCGAFYEISSGIVDFFSLDKNGFVVDI